MKNRLRTTFALMMVGSLALVGSAAAQGNIEVTITNLTPGQIASPPVVISHNGYFKLFNPGDAASEELAMLAEDAISDPLVMSLGADPDVFDVVVGDAGIGPGGSLTVMVAANGSNRYITVAGMLVTTNDAFYSAQGVAINSTPTMATGYGWDAGSEANNEDCAYIPGPPCENPEVHTETSEGFIHIHNGVHGIADLESQLFDWNNPVVRVTVTRVQ